MSCEFCERADFGNYRAEVDNGHAHISLAGGSYRFPKNVQFAFCPMCGAALSDPRPLTLDELRERDGRPVWVENPADKKYEGFFDEWALVNTGKGTAESNITIYRFQFYGIHWLAYDLTPKEDA